MKIGIVQLNTIVGDVDGNMAKGRLAIEQCVDEGADVIVLSELFTTGYPPKDLIYRKDLIDANLIAVNMFTRWSAELRTTIVFGFVEPNPVNGQKDHFNAVMTVQNGEIVNKRRKTLLPTYDVFNEDRYFEPGYVSTEFNTFDLNGMKVGVINCEEAWNDEEFWKERLYSFDPVSRMVAAGAEYLIFVNASPYRMGVVEKRYEILKAHCIKHSIGCVYVNQVGYNDDVGFDGNSFAMNPKGEITYQADSFEETVEVIYSTARPIRPIIMSWQDEVLLALTTGVRDYFDKLGITGPAIIGLSGGIDSALVAYIAVQALGPARVVGIGMPSKFSSEGSVTDAARIAKKLGIRFAIEPIKPLHAAARTALDDVFEQLHEGNIKVADSGVTDENIQARLRMIYLMACSNKLNGIVLSTGNKSEMSVGYCTMYGDMAGGLAVISDVLKTKVFDLCRWINEKRKDEIVPYATIDKPPSAELREGQTDQQSLPPYPVLDEVIIAFVEKSKAPYEIAAVMLSPVRNEEYAKTFSRNLENDIYWVCQTTARNEYKRKQAPTGLKVTEKLFRSGWEHPIVNRLPIRGIVKSDTGTAPTFPLEGK